MLNYMLMISFGKASLRLFLASVAAKTRWSFDLINVLRSLSAKPKHSYLWEKTRDNKIIPCLVRAFGSFRRQFFSTLFNKVASLQS